MASMVTVTGATELAADLLRASSKAQRESEAVVKKAAQNLKDQLNGQFAASKHYKAAAGSVTYDMIPSFGSWSAEVGPDKARRSGAIANIAFFGGSRGGKSLDLDGPVRAEAARFQSELSKLAAGLL